MKILTRAELLKLPSGVLYSTFHASDVFSGLYRKKENLNNDWTYESLTDRVKGCFSSEEISIKVMSSQQYKESFSMTLHRPELDDSEDSQLFAVYEQEDIKQLLMKLMDSAVGYPKI